MRDKRGADAGDVPARFTGIPKNRIYSIQIQSIEEFESDGEESRNALHKKFRFR